MNNSDYAIDTASRFGDIPFVEFTKGLVTGVFDSLLETHLSQMEEYANFVNSLTQDLSTYINNTKDNVSFNEISDFVLNYELPEIDNTALTKALEKLETPPYIDNAGEKEYEKPATSETWWGGLINGLAPAVSSLVDKISDPNEKLKYDAFVEYNNLVLEGVAITADKIPTFKQIHDAIASLIVSNKYGLLQTIAKQGALRLVVTDGLVESKITFSTWNNSYNSKSNSNYSKSKNKSKAKDVRGGGLAFLFRNKRKRKNVNRTVTVNTAKSYQRDTSGTSVNIFGRVLLNFKTDYAPLNG